MLTFLLWRGFSNGGRGRHFTAASFPKSSQCSQPYWYRGGNWWYGKGCLHTTMLQVFSRDYPQEQMLANAGSIYSSEVLTQAVRSLWKARLRWQLERVVVPAQQHLRSKEASLTPEHSASGTMLTLAQTAALTTELTLVQFLLQTAAKLDT